jgi:hypothetical protein
MHSAITMNPSNVLRQLIRACVDEERTLLHECKFVDAARGSTLTRMAREREQFVADLQRHDTSGSRRPNGSWVELVREAGRNAWVAAAGPNSGDAIATCRHARARTEAVYVEAMHESWPEEVGRLLAGQWRRLNDEATELNQLRV